MIYAILAQIIGKENICFFIVPPSGGTPVFKYVEETDDPGLRPRQAVPTKISLLSWKLNHIPSHLTKLYAAIPPR